MIFSPNSPCGRTRRKASARTYANQISIAPPSIGPMVGGGIEIWFAYVLALGFLLVRPQGLFGEKIIDRV